MNKDLIIALLALAFAGCAAALLVVIAKWQEEKERRFDEISRAVGIENDLERAMSVIENQQTEIKAMEFRIGQVRLRNRNLQDRLSEEICPTSNHIWKDGRCVKCGRVQDD